MSDIDYYKNKVYSLKNDKEKYQYLKEKLNDSLKSELNQISDDLEEAITKINNGFVIDDITADGKSIKKTNDLIKSYKNKISDEVIPSINEKIRSINNNIYYYNNLIEQLEEAEEAKKAEEAQAEEDSK